MVSGACCYPLQFLELWLRLLLPLRAAAHRVLVGVLFAVGFRVSFVLRFRCTGLVWGLLRFLVSMFLFYSPMGRTSNKVVK